MIKAVLFDLDNTIIDFLLMKRKSCEAAVDAMIDAGLNVPKKKTIETLFELYDKHGMEDPMIFQKLLAKLLNKIDYHVLAEGIVAYRKAQISYIRTYPGTKNTLMALKTSGIKLAIVSDAPSLKAWIRLVEMGIPDFFDTIVTFHDTGVAKPSPLPFRRAVKLLGVRAKNCLFVGDYMEKDIQGAKTLGMKTAFARYGAVELVGRAGRTKPFRPENSGADFDIDSISEVVTIVKNENKK